MSYFNSTKEEKKDMGERECMCVYMCKHETEYITKMEKENQHSRSHVGYRRNNPEMLN